MSKKPGKAAARKAPKKTAAKKSTAKRSAPVSRASAASVNGGTASGRTKTVTILIYRTDGGNRIRTSPQRRYANPGDHLEFNVVNMVDGSEVPVTIEFPDGGPWGKDPFEIRNWDRKSLADAPLGRYKYTVSALGAEEDPEVELPDGN